MVGHPEDEVFDCGCDQTFTIAHLHQPEKGQYVVAHDRGFIAEKDIFKTAVFDENGGI